MCIFINFNCDNRSQKAECGFSRWVELKGVMAGERKCGYKNCRKDEKSEGETECGAARAEWRAEGIASQNWISLHGRLIPQESTSWAIHGMPTVTPHSENNDLHSLGSRPSAGRDAASPGSLLFHPTVAAESGRGEKLLLKGERPQTPDSHCGKMRDWQLWKR